MRLICLFTLGILSCTCVCRAQTTLLGWDVNGTSESASTLTGAVGTNILSDSTSGILSRGSGAALPGNPASNSFGASGFSASSLATAIATNDYLSFTIAPSSGYALSLSSITIRLNNTTGGPTGGALLSSVGGFSDSAAIQTFSFTSNANNDQTITLSATTFSGLTSPVEFRLYGYGGGTASTDKLRIRNLSNNDLSISGSVSAVPEPSTYATLAGLSALLFAAMRRRRR